MHLERSYGQSSLIQELQLEDKLDLIVVHQFLVDLSSTNSNIFAFPLVHYLILTKQQKWLLPTLLLTFLHLFIIKG